MSPDPDTTAPATETVEPTEADAQADAHIPEGRGFRETTIKTSNSYFEAAEKLKAKGLYPDKSAKELAEVLRRWANRNGVTTAYVAPANANARMAQRLALAEAALEKLMHIATDIGEQPDNTVVVLCAGRMTQVLIEYDQAHKPLVG